MLILDDDTTFLRRAKASLEVAGVKVVCAQTVRSALEAVRLRPIDLAVVDYRLRGKENGLVFGRTCLDDHRLPFILVSGFLTTELTVQAMRLGAFDVIDKPLTSEQLVRAVSSALRGDLDRTSPPADSPGVTDWATESQAEETVPQRWARLMLRACEARHDPRTVGQFAKAATVSASVFRTVCTLCLVRPDPSCDLGRILRALSLSLSSGAPVVSHLSVGDARTARRLLDRAGLISTRGCPDLHDFFRKQRFVPTELECLKELSHRAANSPLFTKDDWEEREG